MNRKAMSIVMASLLLLPFTGCGQVADDQVRNARHLTGAEYNGHQDRAGRTTAENPRIYGQISSEDTDTPSSEYPHTRAVQIQHAKYAFITVDEQGKEQTVQLPEEVTRVLPKGVERLTPEQIKRLLPDNLSHVLPKGSEHLTPEAIANAIKESGLQGQEPGQTPEPSQNQPEQQPPVQEQPQATPAQPTQPEAAPEPAQPRQEQQPEQAQETPTQQPRAEGLSEMEAKVVELTNQERRKNGLPDFQADAPLSNVARTKSSDMRTNNYFSHTSPTYGSPFDMMRDMGISYNAAGENIAQGQRSAEEVVQAWMNSEGHRANILSNDYTHIGVGHDPNGNYWTQMFIN